MEEVRVISTLGPSGAHSAKPSTSPSSNVKSGRSESRGTPTPKDPNEGVPSTTAARSQQKIDSLTEANAVINDLNQKLEVAHNTLRFHIDDTTEEIKVQVVDKDTGKVVRTIPPEPSLSILSQGEFSGLLSVQG